MRQAASLRRFFTSLTPTETATTSAPATTVRPGDEFGHARGIGSAASQHFPRDRTATASMQQVGQPARHRVTVLAHPDSCSDGVTDHDDAEQVAATADLTGGPGGLGEPLDPASHSPALEHDHGQEGEHAGPAQLIG